MRSRKRTGLLVYDRMDFECWCFDEGDAKESLHCGEAIAIRLADQYLAGRIEMDRSGNWIIIFSGQDQTPFILKQDYRYPARMK